MRVLVLSLAALPAFAQDDPRLEFAKGLLDQSRGRQEEAQARFEKARKADPTAMPLVRRAAAHQIAEGNLAAAVTLYRELAAATPDRLGTQLAYADFLRDEGRGDGLADKLAGEVLEKALKRFPASPGVLDRLFRNSEARQNRKRSLELFDELIAKPPLNPSAMLLSENWSRLLFAGNDREARERLDRLFKESSVTYPENAALARAASEHFRKNGNLEEALAVLSRHVEAVPADLDLRTRLGILQLAAKQTEAGEATLKEVVSIDGRRALAHESLAKLYRQEGKPELARPHADAALRIRGGDPEAFLALADEWLEAGQPKAARILLEKAVYDHPENSELAAKLAIATRRDPETRARASRLFREAESILPADAPPDPDFLAESANALIDENLYPAAEERLRKAIRAYPADAKQQTAATLRQLAGLWESQGKNAEAAHALRQRADALDPGVGK